MLDQIQFLVPLTAGILGLVCIFVLFFSYKSNIFVNFYFVIFIFIVCFRHLDIGLEGLFKSLNKSTYQSYFTAISLIGVPSLYLYFKSLYKDIKSFNVFSLLHFLFPIFNFLWCVVEMHIIDFNFYYLNYLQIVFVLMFLIYYAFKITKLVYKKIIIKDVNTISVPDLKHHNLIKKWSFLLYGVLLILGSRLLFAIYTEITSDVEIFVRGYVYYWPSSILWIITFVTILINPEILYGKPKFNKIFSNVSEDGLTQPLIWDVPKTKINDLQYSELDSRIYSKKEEYLFRINTYVKEHNPFRDSKYKIKDLAKDLKVPVSHLSYIFKYHCSLPFVEYRNYARINDAKNLIDNDFLEDKTIEALSLKVGFTSYNPFYVSFKKHIGKSPKDYLLSKIGQNNI